jgi:hypothetical protein
MREWCRPETGVALTQCYRNYHKLQPVDKIVFKERLKHIRASHHVQVRTIGLFQLPDVFREIAA